MENPLRRVDLPDGEFTYEMDFEGLERLAADPSNVLMLLCNPHNPAGRVWRREEIERVAEICRRNGVRVVSDEIHCELTMPGYRYVPYGTVDPSAVVCLSPSKAFNTAGLQIANIIVADPGERKLIDRAVNINEVCDVNPFGVEALKAAYSPEGSEWLDALRAYIYENYCLLREYLGRRLPQCAVARLEGTYLPWVDISKFGSDADELAGGLLDKAGVWVNSGSMYGDGAYLRINIACPRRFLKKGSNGYAGILRGLHEQYKLTGGVADISLIRSGAPLSFGSQLRLTLQLSWPAMMAQLSSIMMQYIDAAMVGRLGADDSAAVGLVSTSLWLFRGICSAVTVGFSVQVAHRIGASDHDGARRILRQSIVACLLFSLAVVAVGRP